MNQPIYLSIEADFHGVLRFIVPCPGQQHPSKVFPVQNRKEKGKSGEDNGAVKPG